MWGVRCHVGGHADGHRQGIRRGAGTPAKLLTDLPYHNQAGHHKIREYPQRLQDAGGGGLPGRGDLPGTRGGRGDTDTEMIEEGERSDGEPSGPQGAAETEEVPPLVPTGDAVSPEEDAFLMQQASQPVDPAAGSHSPRSKTSTVSGEMAELSLTSPSQPGPGEDETQQ